MTQETFVCAREDCADEYVKKTHNQRYCSDECCKVATNKRIMSEYYRKKARRSGAERICEECEVTKLSRYNDSDYCAACREKRESSLNQSVANLLLNTSLIA